MLETRANPLRLRHTLAGHRFASDLFPKLSIEGVQFPNCTSVAGYHPNLNLRCTPAMAAGVTNRLWSVEELIEATQ